MMEKQINNLQSQRPEPLRVVSESTARIKPPRFDGSSTLSVFKFQLEAVAGRNGWDDGSLQRKFGDEHKRELYRMELRCRAQKANSSKS